MNPDHSTPSSSENPIVIVVGTNRKNSMSSQIAAYYQTIFERIGAKTCLLDLSGLPADFTTTALYENTGKNPEFNRFKEVIEKARKLVFVIPEYNNSYPGVLKAFIDGMSYPHGLANKKVAMVGISANHQGAALAMSHLNDIFSYLGTHTLALRVKLAQIKQYWKDGSLHNDLYNELLELQARQLIDF